MNTMKIFAAACLLSSRLCAQDTTNLQDHVVVTATKMPIKQSQTGKVITVINQQTLQQSNGMLLTELLNRQAGITIVGAMQPMGSNQSIFMRGAATGRTLITIDGIPVNDASNITNEFDINLIPTHNIEQIEICRGAQSTLYGSDAIAGVINIITKKGKANKPIQANAHLSSGTFNTYKTNISLFGADNEGSSYNIGYAYIKTNGFSAAYDSAQMQRNFDNDGYKQSTLNMQFVKQIIKGLQLNTHAQLSTYKTSIDQGGFRDELDYTSKNSNQLFGAALTYIYPKGRLQAQYTYNEGQRTLVNDSIDKPSFTTYSKDKYESATKFAELYNTINIGRNMSLLTGVDYRDAKVNQTNFSISSFGPYTDALGSDSLFMNQVSFYGSFYYAKNKFNIELGGRYNIANRFGNSTTFTFNPSYNVNNTWRIFGSVATGYKAPTLYQLYSFAGNKNIKPETSINYELGTQYRNKNNNARIVGFYRDIEQGLDFDYINFVYYNAQRQKVAGVELETTIQLHKKMSLTANYTYINGTENIQSRITFNDTTYNNLLRRPKHNVNVTLGLQLTPLLYVNASVKHVGTRLDVGGYAKPDVELNAYTVLNAYASFRICKQLDAMVELKNITNTTFYEINGFNAMPFNINIGFNVRL